jgi:hypothetical protein
MLRTKTLDWKPIPDREHKCDVYAERDGSRWMVKRAVAGHSTWYVLRLNGVVIKRCELQLEAKRLAEQMVREREDGS